MLDGKSNGKHHISCENEKEKLLIATETFLLLRWVYAEDGRVS
jgi:hypothetical protein